MLSSSGWRRFWEAKAGANLSDFELDRGASTRTRDTERLSEQELISFTGPNQADVLLDAGCGTGVNIIRFHSRVKRIVGLDYASGSLARCRKNMQTGEINNVAICLASVTEIPLPDCAVDRVLCLSVLQYLDDAEARRALQEFVRVLVPGGTIVLHVKNSSSLYWSTLRFAKSLKSLFGKTTHTYHLRSFRWYFDLLESMNCKVVDYRSFNLLLVESLPKRIAHFLQGYELRHYESLPWRIPFIRRRGAELKIKAIVTGRPATRMATTAGSTELEVSSLDRRSC